MKHTLINIFLFVFTMIVSISFPLIIGAFSKLTVFLDVKLEPVFRSINIFICGIEAKIMSLFGIADYYDYCDQMHKSYNKITRYRKKNDYTDY